MGGVNTRVVHERQLTQAGQTGQVGKLKHTGVSSGKLKHTGVSSGKLKHTGVSSGKLKHTGVSSGKLKHTGVSSDKLKHTGVMIYLTEVYEVVVSKRKVDMPCWVCEVVPGKGNNDVPH